MSTASRTSSPVKSSTEDPRNTVNSAPEAHKIKTGKGALYGSHSFVRVWTAESIHNGIALEHRPKELHIIFSSSDLYSAMYLSLHPRTLTLSSHSYVAAQRVPAVACFLYQRKYQANLHHTIESIIKSTLSNLISSDYLTTSPCS